MYHDYNPLVVAEVEFGNVSPPRVKSKKNIQIHQSPNVPSTKWIFEKNEKKNA